MKKVEDASVDKNTKIRDLLAEYHKSGGFVTKKIADGAAILQEMLKTCEINILSFPSCIISTGTRGVIRDLVKNKKFNMVMTTCGTLDHDFARSFADYYHGTFDADDVELHRRGIYRLGNLFIPVDNYGKAIEDNIKPILQDIYDSGLRNLATFELVWEIGKRMKNKGSIIYWCAKNKVPMIIPGITDGAFGFQLLMFMQDHKDFNIDVFKDEQFLLDKFFGAKMKTGSLMIGGGISRHHVIWWNQFKDGLDYAVYVTTAVEYDGSLSGARTKEAVSWGKIKEKAKHVTIEGDATVILPLLLGYVI